MLLKSCRCGKLIPQSMKMCEECEQRQQSRHMIYNNTRRDERAAEFYVSKEWRAMRERIIEVYDNVDIYALYVEHELLTCNPVHHIIELEDDWEQRLNPFNLIPLNHKTHNTIEILELMLDTTLDEMTELIPNFDRNNLTSRQKLLAFMSVKELYDNRDKYRSDTKTLSAAVSSMLLKEIYGGTAE